MFTTPRKYFHSFTPKGAFLDTPNSYSHINDSNCLYLLRILYINFSLHSLIPFGRSMFAIDINEWFNGIFDGSVVHKSPLIDLNCYSIAYLLHLPQISADLGLRRKRNLPASLIHVILVLH